MSTEDSKRLRKMTDKGQEYFEEQRSQLFGQLEFSFKILEENIQDLESNFPKSTFSIEIAEDTLLTSKDRYLKNMSEYIDFLSRNNSPEGREEQEKLRSNSSFIEIKKRLRLVLDQLSEVKKNLDENRSSAYSVKSYHSIPRSKSSISKRQMEEEELLKTEQTKIALRLELLSLEREQAKQNSAPKRITEEERILLPQDTASNTQERTRKYVESLNTEARSQFEPHVENITTLAQFLCRKDILKDRLYSFNGKCEHYMAWKDTFKMVMGDIGANASEELDLLLRWAGSGTRQISSIKTANAGDPELGLARAWDRLDLQFGSAEKIEQALRMKLNNVQRITFKDKSKLFELSDVLSELRAVKEKPQYSALFSYLDTAAGVNPTINKLPLSLQNKWRDRALSYKRSKNVLFPPYTFFCDFILDMAVSLNDPSFDFDVTQTTKEESTRSTRHVSVAKTTAVEEKDSFPCFLHKGTHPINDCRTFRHKTLEQRRQLLKQHGICFRCCAGKHLSKDCDRPIKCVECISERHSTAMHLYKTSNCQGERNYGGEQVNNHERNKTNLNVESRCTELCKDGTSKSCAKVVLVNIKHKKSNIHQIRAYAIIDDQSNYSLARSELFNKFNIRTAATPYSVKSCSGKVTLTGRQASGFVVESIDGLEQIVLPTITECDMIPDNRNEIPTPQVARSHPHLACIAGSIPPIDEEAYILLLIGRDALPAHYVLDQKLGNQDQPFAQKLKLGWTIIGECCLDGVHVPYEVNSMKTNIHSNGRPTTLELCENSFSTEQLFATTKDDNKPGWSWEDKRFSSLMEKEMKRTIDGSWEAPLPFKEQRPRLPQNRDYAARRTQSFISSLRKDTLKKQHTMKFMEDLFENGHAERAPDVDSSHELWYLPLFGVYHPKKKDRIRIVFDSSAKCGGLSLNDVLMTGPNLTNNLLGVLMRFRRERVAVIGDIQQMFYSFLVRPDHRDYLRFVWPENNDLNRGLVDYRMKVHVFGNSPSPAVATFGLHKTAEIAEPVVGKDLSKSIKRNFYVDDSLSSHPSSDKAIYALQKTQSALKEFGNLRLHKICSNSSEVLAAFNKEDLAKDLKDLDFDKDCPLQRSLGVCWNIQNDSLTFDVPPDENVFTRRGILSTINGIYDPIGLAAAFTIIGKLLMREICTGSFDWDDPLPEEFLERWKSWKRSIESLKKVQVPRMYSSLGMTEICHRSLHIYSDASQKAVAAVAYLLSSDSYGNQNFGFVLGKAKVAPKHGHTIPRLELCAAVLSIELYEICSDELDMEFSEVKFFTDSKVVLGYIYNQTKRFHIYVGNRIDRIKSVSNPEQWNYVPSLLNPADDATRGITAENLPDSKWIKGPNHSITIRDDQNCQEQSFPLVLPEQDREIRTLKTEFSGNQYLGCQRFERFSSWTSVIRSVATLRKHVLTRSGNTEDLNEVANREQTQNLIIKALQQDCYMKELLAVKNNNPIQRDSRIRNLSPYLDENGILCVGGRLKHARVEQSNKNPIIIPQHHVSMLLVRHYHEKIHHQGRHLTEGAIRSAGYWVVGCKRQVARCIYNCIQCRKLRSRPESQKMSDLPLDRIDPLPPFTNVGIDVFGPWQVVARKTRGGQANSKRWALMITCLVVRAVHIEILEEMTSSCFINAFRRFCAIRGEVKIIRSDCGTNFVGSTKDLKANVINVEHRPVKNYLTDSGINWIFNPPHSSHMGGAWERMIGIARRILDAMLKDVKHLTHDILNTLMTEVSSIMNARPLVPISTDPENPFVLTPATLLTLKTNHSVKSFKMDDFNKKDLFKSQWRCVQHFANVFWSRWRNEYLHTLQCRRKWQDKQTNPEIGDIVLLYDKAEYRNDWPVGIIMSTHIGEDESVRSVDVRLGRDDKTYTRPVKEVVMLLPKKSQKD